jgi:glucose/arabinose dehydrogenase
MSSRFRWLLGVGLASVVATAPVLGSGDAHAATKPIADVALEPAGSVEHPTAMAVRPGDSTLYVAEQTGRVVALSGGRVEATVLDLRKEVSHGSEQGLLGITFSPDGALLYVNYTNRQGDTRIEEYPFANGAASVGGHRVLLKVHQPQANHNGGQITYLSSGLYIGLGDGGGTNDEGPGHAGGGNGQSVKTLLGKILRLDPRPTNGVPYTSPADNPFVDRTGRDEIWAYGLRNPWRFSFDRATDDLWVADVGQDEFEEIDFVAAKDKETPRGRGANFGWNIYEGNHLFRDGDLDDHLAPIVELSHKDGFCAVIGGFVYRGTAIPELDGAYVYSDYCDGRLRWVRQEKGVAVAHGKLGVSVKGITSFGEDNDGELYVLSESKGVSKIVPG